METTDNEVLKIAVIKASPRKNKGKQKETRDLSFTSSFTSSIMGRKRGSSEFDYLLTVIK